MCVPLFIDFISLFYVFMSLFKLNCMNRKKNITKMVRSAKIVMVAEIMLMLLVINEKET